MTVGELAEVLRGLPQDLRAEDATGREIEAATLVTYGDRNPYVLVE